MPFPRYLPLAGLSAYDFVHEVDQVLSLTSPKSFPYFVDYFLVPILEAHTNGVASADLANTIRVDAESWAERETRGGPTRRAAEDARIALRAPWYFNEPGRKAEHVRAVHALHEVRRALAVVEPELDLAKSRGRRCSPQSQPPFASSTPTTSPSS